MDTDPVADLVEGLEVESRTEVMLPQASRVLSCEWRTMERPRMEVNCGK